MLRKEQNDLLTRTGPGTPMGEMFRRYWIPALLAEELPENDCPPVRVQLLSEKLIAFRDTEGRYGLMDEFCAHRGVSLWFGRERGMRSALSVSRLEIRRDRPVRGDAIRAGEERLPRDDQAAFLSVGRARRRAVDLYGAAGASARIAGIRVRHGAAGPDLHIEAAAILQLASGDGGRHQFQSCLMAASRCAAHRSVDGRFARQPVQHGRRRAGVPGGGPSRRPVHRCAAQCGGRLLLAHHALVHAVIHHDSAARQPSGARPFLDSDRR